MGKIHTLIKDKKAIYPVTVPEAVIDPDSRMTLKDRILSILTAIAGKVSSNLIGVANGIAELDSSGKVPSSQLPSYVDDVLDAHVVGTALSAGWLSLTEGGAALTPESGKIYVVLSVGDYQNKTYRWSGSTYVEIASGLILGEASANAYRGDRGKIAYGHSQAAHAPSNAQENVIEAIKLNGNIVPVYNKMVQLNTSVETPNIIIAKNTDELMSVILEKIALIENAAAGYNTWEDLITNWNNFQLPFHFHIYYNAMGYVYDSFDGIFDTSYDPDPMYDLLEWLRVGYSLDSPGYLAHCIIEVVIRPIYQPSNGDLDRSHLYVDLFIRNIPERNFTSDFFQPLVSEECADWKFRFLADINSPELTAISAFKTLNYTQITIG